MHPSADDEDIDIVGDDHTNNNNRERSNLSLSSSDASRDLQLHVYGPPQFSEADVLTCMSQLEEEADLKRNDNAIKMEAQSPDLRMKEETFETDCDERRNEAAEDVETLKAKLRQMEGSAKCSKCDVSLFVANALLTFS